MLPDYCIFKTFFMSFSYITQILLKLGNWDLSHIVGFFIFYEENGIYLNEKNETGPNFLTLVESE